MKKSGFTLIELLVAVGMSAIFITAASQVFGQIYLAQKKIEVSQNLYDESRFLMERITKIMRENTIDYDRYFEKSGPSLATCPNFDGDQISNTASDANTEANRIALGYPSIFYWDTNNNGTQDYNLGGLQDDASLDPCTVAFNGLQNVLYLINADRTVRTAIQKNTDDRIEIDRQLGADNDGDGIVDFWSNTASYTGGVCKIEYPTSSENFYEVLGDSNSETFCETAHVNTVISPQIIEVETISFDPAPDRDPFLSFKVPSSRIHPNIFVSIKTVLNSPTRYSFTLSDRPWILLQTAVSSRLFGDTRK